MYLTPDDSPRFWQRAVCFNDSGGCEDVIHSQVMTVHQLLRNVQHLKAQRRQSAPKHHYVFNYVFDQYKLFCDNFER